MDRINVTAPSLAPLNEYIKELSHVWKTGVLTNNGPQVQRLERDLSKNLGLDDFIAVTNGTVALQMAIKTLIKPGEIITPAFSWIATASAIKSEGCTPVFCDINEQSLNIDILKIEELITDRTVAIMPVHVFGNPCEVEALQAISQKYNIPIIYDAAHAVGSTRNGRSILYYGDISAVSTHATKIFNTGEGGGLYSRNPGIMDRLRKIRLFGHNDKKDIVMDGFNGKMSEIHAALGNANLKYYSETLDDRRHKWLQYYRNLSKKKFFKFQNVDMENTNFSYFPIILKDERSVKSLISHLETRKIYPRRYFYPSLNTISLYKADYNCPISEEISKTIICLPLSTQVTFEQIDLISATVLDWSA